MFSNLFYLSGYFSSWYVWYWLNLSCTRYCKMIYWIYTGHLNFYKHIMICYFWFFDVLFYL